MMVEEVFAWISITDIINHPEACSCPRSLRVCHFQHLPPTTLPAPHRHSGVLTQ